MIATKPDYFGFRERLRGRERLLGTFIKMATTQPIEILGAIGYDFVVLDQEHAPLGRAEIDLLVLASRAANVAPLVRVGDTADAAVLSALDCGAVGVMFPHISSAAGAEKAVRSCRYASGSRGFAGMTRASDWGTRRSAEHMQRQDLHVCCIAMIEDTEAVEQIEKIVRVKGLDAIFIGRGDLSSKLAHEAGAAHSVARLSERVARAAGEAGVPLMMLVSDKSDAMTVREWGATALLVASDHNFLKAAAADAFAQYSAI